MLQSNIFAVLFMNENLTNVVIGKLGQLIHKQNCKFFIDYTIIIVQVRHTTIETKDLLVLDLTGFFF